MADRRRNQRRRAGGSRTGKQYRPLQCLVQRRIDPLLQDAFAIQRCAARDLRSQYRILGGIGLGLLHRIGIAGEAPVMTRRRRSFGRDPTPDCVEQVIVVAGRHVSDEPEIQTASSTVLTTDGVRVRAKARPGMTRPVLKAASRSCIVNHAGARFSRPIQQRSATERFLALKKTSRGVR
jgi:hypothetical protein